MTDGDEPRYTATEAARIIGCSFSTVRKHASRLFGPRRRPGTHLRLTAAQVEQLRQSIAAHRRQPPGATSA